MLCVQYLLCVHCVYIACTLRARARARVRACMGVPNIPTYLIKSGEEGDALRHGQSTAISAVALVRLRHRVGNLIQVFPQLLEGQGERV